MPELQVVGRVGPVSGFKNQATSTCLVRWKKLKKFGMDSNVKQAIINEISNTLITNRPLTLKYQDRAVATILPVEDYQKFQAEREEKLKELKTELGSILNLICSYTRHQSLAELEAELLTLRHNIEQEME